METWMWLVLWGGLILVVALLWARERRAGRKVDFDADAPRGQADTEARMRRDGRGPNMSQTQ